MVPSSVTGLEEWPLNSAGKVDRKRLPDPDERAMAATVAQDPVGSMEQLIVECFKTVMKTAHVGRTTGFFHIGGDSILAIKATGIARRQGVVFSVTDLLQYQTPASLALVATRHNASHQIVATESDSGTVALSPIQKWFFHSGFEQAHHWNQAFSLSLNGASRIEQQRLQKALTQVCTHHGMLRSRFQKEEQGWRQYILPSEKAVAPLLHILDVVDEDQVRTELTKIQGGFKLTADGPLWCATLVRMANAHDRVVLAFHHLIIDAVSWRILEEDLSHAYLGQELPSKTTSFGVWVSQLDTFLASQPHWAGQRAPLGHMDTRIAASERTVDRQCVLHSHLDTDSTHLLLTVANQAFQTRPQELMLVGLLLAYHEWCGRSLLGVLLEGHGREAFHPSIDLSRTVGWFTALQPVILKLVGDVDINDDNSLASVICSVKEQIRSAPENIRRFGVRFDREEDFETLPDLVFNYLGQFNLKSESSVVGLTLDGQETGEEEGIQNHVPEKLSLNGSVTDGKLTMTWSFDKVEYRAASISEFAEAWSRAMCRLTAVGSRVDLSRRTPSDWPWCGLKQHELDSVLARLPAEHTDGNIMQLTPLQSGLVAGTLLNPTAYVVQQVFQVHGTFDVDRLHQAWEQVAQNVDVLRTRIYLEGLVTPVQVVLDGPGPFVGWQKLAGHSLSTDARLELVSSVSTRERSSSFSFESSPLLRLVAIECGDVVYVIETRHHSILDGWSSILLQQSVMQCYEGNDVTPSPPYSMVRE